MMETVQRLPFLQGEEDAHGNPVESWGGSVPLLIRAFNPGSTDEPFVEGHDRTITRPVLYTDLGVTLHARDRVVRRGVTYEVDGDLLVFENPHDSSRDGCQANLKVVSG